MPNEPIREQNARVGNRIPVAVNVNDFAFFDFGILGFFIVDIMVVMASIVQLVPYRRGVHFRILAQTGPSCMDSAPGFGTNGGLKGHRF